MNDYRRFYIPYAGEFTSVPKEYAELCRHISDGGSDEGNGLIPAGELADRIEQLNSA